MTQKIEVPYPYAFKHYAFGIHKGKHFLIKADSIERLHELAEKYKIDITDWTIISPETELNIYQ